LATSNKHVMTKQSSKDVYGSFSYCRSVGFVENGPDVVAIPMVKVMIRIDQGNSLYC
jgi:hypothetical protein